MKPYGIFSMGPLPHSHPPTPRWYVFPPPVVELAERSMRRMMRTRKLRMHEATKLDDFASPVASRWWRRLARLPETTR